MQGALHKTLIIRLSSVGDVVLSSPLVRALHGRFPDCQIDFLLKSEYADLMRDDPHLTRVLEFPADGTLGDLIRLRRLIGSAHYDLIVDIHDSLRSRFLCAGAPHVVRVNKRKIARALLIRFKIDLYDRWGGSPGVAERYIETGRRYGVEADGAGPALFLPDGVASTVTTMLDGEDLPPDSPCIGICPSAKHANKMWPLEHFALAASQLAQSRDAAVLLFGSAAERARCERIAQLSMELAPEVRVVNLAGWTSLLETAAAMDRCSVVITNDTGLMHIAAARGVQVVAIFGPTVRQFGVFPPTRNATVVENAGLQCRPCTHIGLPNCPEGHFRCMNDIPVSAVVAAAERRMEEK